MTTTAPKDKALTGKVGETIEVSEGARVVRPDGFSVTVAGGLYVLTQAGRYDVEGQELNAK